MATLDSTELRKGIVFKDSGKVFIVLTYKHVKKGRGLAIIRVKVRDVESGSIVEKTYSSKERVESADLEHKDAQYLYSDADYFYFMDCSDYSQFQISRKIVEDYKDFLTEGLKIKTLWLEDKVVGLQVPKKVVLEVVSTEPGIVGDTAGSATKNADLETGLKIQVPIFIKKGDKIIVNTELVTYVSKE
ncbi:elongation factor P [Candidatus Dojkabacteria bacterium]|nr:elongation factor P [Candidatus Dojkabacteria bacterium]